jgi:G:T/U-mismatch repair DNA glycosylase
VVFTETQGQLQLRHMMFTGTQGQLQLRDMMFTETQGKMQLRDVMFTETQGKLCFLQLTRRDTSLTSLILTSQLSSTLFSYYINVW